MTKKKMIYCSYLMKESESLDCQCYPGTLGKKIYKNISQKAWDIWQKKQIILINERKLNMSDINHRKILEEEMIHFLFKK